MIWGIYRGGSGAPEGTRVYGQSVAVSAMHAHSSKTAAVLQELQAATEAAAAAQPGPIGQLSE